MVLAKLNEKDWDRIVFSREKETKVTYNNFTIPTLRKQLAQLYME